MAALCWLVAFYNVSIYKMSMYKIYRVIHKKHFKNYPIL